MDVLLLDSRNVGLDRIGLVVFAHFQFHLRCDYGSLIYRADHEALEQVIEVAEWVKPGQFIEWPEACNVGHDYFSFVRN